MATDYVACYRDTRTALTALTRSLDDPDQARPVPATPGWDVRDVVGHVVGISADLLAGNLAGAGTDEWTAAQVDPRRGVPLADVLAEWSDRAPTLEEQVASWPPEFAATLVADLATHDLDVRGALGRRDRATPQPSTSRSTTTRSGSRDASTRSTSARSASRCPTGRWCSARATRRSTSLRHGSSWSGR